MTLLLSRESVKVSYDLKFRVVDYNRTDALYKLTLSLLVTTLHCTNKS